MRSDGIRTLIRLSLLRGDTVLSQHLSGDPLMIYVHKSCDQLKYAKEGCIPEIPSEINAGSTKTLRSVSDKIDYKTCCFLCCQPAYERYREVQTSVLNQTMLRICEERNDEWGFQISGRLKTCGDLRAADARYHIKCHLYFTTFGDKPSASVCTANVRGRPVSSEMMAYFDIVCEWVENGNCELFTVRDLHEQMVELAGDPSKVYCIRYIKHLLVKRFGDHIFFASVCGRTDVICFRNMASRILNDQWYADRDKDVNIESERIVSAAAQLIKASIRDSIYDTEQYPLNADISQRSAAKNWVPPLLRLFLQGIVCDELKQIALGHSIVQASRPRSVISPVLFGIGVSLDHVLASKWLLTVLSRLGFSVSSEEVNRYKQSIVQTNESDLPQSHPHSFTQWSADNVDHNIVTLNGLGVFHGMGIMSMSVPCVGLSDSNGCGSFGETAVKRLERVKVMKLTRGRNVPLMYYISPNEPPLSSLKFTPIADINKLLISQPPSLNLDLMWHTGWLFREEHNARPNWSGYMQMVHVGDHSPPADFRLLPIIDLNPNDKSCIFSTLCFISNQAAKLNVVIACITLDQPPFIKAVEIVQAENMSNIVIRLGGFHMLMSFLGSIGTVMSGSGLEEVLQCCYGPNTVIHMLSGKAVSRALRGHFLVDSALNTILLRSILDNGGESVSSNDVLNHADVETLRLLYDAVAQCDFEAMSSVNNQECLHKLDVILTAYKDTLAKKSRTAKLWLQYCTYIQIVKDFIRAERTGNWNLHLVTVGKMLNLFAATGHNNYAKCSRLYLQTMQELPVKHPWLHDKFMNHGYHSVRRSDRYWAALSTDLLIEQVMMKALKGRGGLTHGRGMTDSVRLLWVCSTHKCASVHNALSSLTNTEYSSNDSQHADLSRSRISTDFHDTVKILEWFYTHNPFLEGNPRLRSIASGLSASDGKGLNCEIAEEVGKVIMSEMDGMSYTDVVLKKAKQVKTLSLLSKKSKIDKNKVIIDNSVLFNRLLLIMGRMTPNDLEPYFKYELTSIPTALFTNNGLRKTNKSTLAKELRKTLVDSKEFVLPETYVVDGGCLLHRIVWQQTGTYGDVVKQYIDFIKRHYGDNCTVVFDGYLNGPSVKDHEHARRAKQSSPDIDVIESNQVYRNSAVFLMNANNKQQFVNLLSVQLMKYHYTVHHANNDADTLIVRTALEKAIINEPVTVVADDTDILVLLLYHFRPEMADIYMLSEIARCRTARRSITPVRAIRTAIGDKAASQLLVIHAISGCDSTSALFGRGKASVYRTVVKHKDTGPLTEILGTPNASRLDTIQAGLKLLTIIYGGKACDSLNHLRYVTYMSQLATSKTQPNPEKLPPTENAAQYHVLRVHFQVMQWKSFMELDIDAEEWGWRVENGVLVPTATDIKPAPDDVLNVISCKCKMVRKNPCSTQVCSCKKHDLRCVAACKHCCGTVCNNAIAYTSTTSPYVDDQDDVETDEEDFQIVLDDTELPDGVELYEEIVSFSLD